MDVWGCGGVGVWVYGGFPDDEERRIFPAESTVGQKENSLQIDQVSRV